MSNRIDEIIPKNADTSIKILRGVRTHLANAVACCLIVGTPLITSWYPAGNPFSLLPRSRKLRYRSEGEGTFFVYWLVIRNDFSANCPTLSGRQDLCLVIQAVDRSEYTPTVSNLQLCNMLSRYWCRWRQLFRLCRNCPYLTRPDWLEPHNWTFSPL